MYYIMYLYTPLALQWSDLNCDSCVLVNNTQQHYTTALEYIKLPMYMLFLWRLYSMVLRTATSLLEALEGVGPENLSLVPFQGPPLPCPLVIMLHASKPLRIAP